MRGKICCCSQAIGFEDVRVALIVSGKIGFGLARYGTLVRMYEGISEMTALKRRHTSGCGRTDEHSAWKPSRVDCPIEQRNPVIGNLYAFQIRENMNAT